ncbi:MAG: sensor histidine kinase [Reichenbachiella sp.]
MKIKLRTWLVICLFGVSSFFAITIFIVVEQSLEDNLLDKTKDQLNSINILKKRLVEQALLDRQTEILHILEYQQSHHTTQENLIDALSSIQDVRQIGIKNCKDCSYQFRAKAIPDSTFYRFEYNLDTIFLRVYLDYYPFGDILKERTGLGTTGESYLVGSDFRMISESIFYPDSLPYDIPCRTTGSIRAFEGNEGIETYPDYRGVNIIGAYRLVNFKGLKIALLTEIDLAEAMNPIKEIRADLIKLLVAILLLSFLGSTLLAEWLQRPVRRLKKTIDQMTLGILPEKEEHNETIEEFWVIEKSMNKLIHALKSTVQFAIKIGKGDMAGSLISLSDKDELGQAIMSMRDQLVILDEQKSVLERKSKKFLIEGQERERERIARDLHDGLGAMLTTMKLKLSQEKDIKANAELVKLLEDAINEARNLSRNLMPSVLSDFGLFEALSLLAQSTKKNTGTLVKFSCEHDGEKSKLKKNKQVYVYRIVQEAINNSLKHAECSEILLTVTEFDDQMNVFIKDNGEGLDEDTFKEKLGLGVKNIQERTELLQGELIIESDKSGTSIDLTIPLP